MAPRNLDDGGGINQKRFGCDRIHPKLAQKLLNPLPNQRTDAAVGVKRPIDNHGAPLDAVLINERVLPKP
jgi:hypothetical protein